MQVHSGGSSVCHARVDFERAFPIASRFGEDATDVFRDPTPRMPRLILVVMVTALIIGVYGIVIGPRTPEAGEFSTPTQPWGIGP